MLAVVVGFTGLDERSQVTDFVVVQQEQTVEVVEEYSVNDLTAFLASLGGSLGLFLGFSCFDCLIMAINAMHDRNKMAMRENAFGEGQESIISTRTEKSTV